ncbi:SDR family NAD(P)-dependent oxidoreductase [Polynucleobacter sp. UB-Siik-W21]|uniref:SDR family NAD(P)-dependent oxidoreductase n=1 Tax=Polynucleobacter sp. UB-Siik-W21 TaxID=1855646 RepID=UPI0020403C57|nr:SDR family NAD(P)-dependent oxidoreductase [Polynucleobacter sp. UB-Siik-W21]QWD70726.1 SDR family NAD(P)-dependent oxidoreductase [Polynucleobacter sp. UB-Siik-W21]
MNHLSIVGRDLELFSRDILNSDQFLRETIGGSRVLVIGGAGSIGRSVVHEVFSRNPKALHVVDLSENNLVEVVRSLRSEIGYIAGDFRTFALDCSSPEFSAFVRHHGTYDYVFNLSALKHVRSERDPFTLMRMINVNIFSTINALRLVKSRSLKNYFCVSTDKAANPVNMMGASKRIMELFLMQESLKSNVTTARFANVAFSDGSLLHGFVQRFTNQQPIAAPVDISRYFVTPKESGQLCLMAGLMGENRNIFFPKMSIDLHLHTLSSVATRFINDLGFEVYECNSEQEARNRSSELIAAGKWPCYFFKSDTTGEKAAEEFFMGHEKLDFDRFSDIGIISNQPEFDADKLEAFENGIKRIYKEGIWKKSQIVDIFKELLEEFDYQDLEKNLDQKM